MLQKNLYRGIFLKISARFYSLKKFPITLRILARFFAEMKLQRKFFALQKNLEEILQKNLFLKNFCFKFPERFLNSNEVLQEIPRKFNFS